jgi:AraC family transcriptional regulator of arabinose operon
MDAPSHVSDVSRLDYRAALASHAVIREALRHPLSRLLVVCGAGRTWHPAGYWITRTEPVPEAILHVCVAGGGWATIAGRRHTVRTGDAFLLPPHVDHSYGAGPESWTLSWLILAGGGLPAVSAALGTTVADPVVAIRDPSEFASTVDEIASLVLADPHLPGAVEASGVAWRLLTHLTSGLLRSARGDPVERVIAYLTEHMASPIRLQDLTAIAGLSRSRLTTTFHAATDRTIIEFLTDLRMAEARRLLRESREPIAAVARHVGYQDPYYFSRVFRQHNLMSPRRFRSAATP